MLAFPTVSESTETVSALVTANCMSVEPHGVVVYFNCDDYGKSAGWFVSADAQLMGDKMAT